MFWFIGSINEAINKSKNEKKVFLVFINGSDDISRKMDNLFESLSTQLSELPIVGIKLESQSDNCKLFSQIYPVILIPSTYFIDYNGVAIEIIGGSVDNKEELIEKIHKTIEIFKKSLPSNEDNKELTTNENTGNSSNASDVNQLTTTASTSGSQSLTSNDSITETTTVSQTTTGIDDKVKRANDLIEAIRQKKAKEEKDREREEEIERRKGMKEMQQAKRLREDKETSDIIKERDREKREEKLARERVLAQIAADKEERRKRQLEFSGQTNVETNVATNIQTDVRQRVVSDKSRIQFRLPDGSTSNHIFEANDSLKTVSQYVSSNFNIRSFILSTTFPRKEFGTEDYCKTLEELSLCPSSVLLVISKGETSISGALTSPSFLWQIVTYLSLPFVMIWNLMTSFFRTDATTTTTTTTTPEDQNRRSAQKRDTKRFYNRDGNIARMRDESPDDDSDNNTWNGNSTQQM